MASARDEMDSPKRKTVKVDFVNEVNGGTIEMSLPEGENPPEKIQVVDQNSGNVAVLQLVNGAYVDVGHHDHCQHHPDHPPLSPSHTGSDGPCAIHGQDPWPNEPRDDRVSKQRQKLKKKLRDKHISSGNQSPQCQCHCSCASENPPGMKFVGIRQPSPSDSKTAKKSSKLQG